MEETLQTDDKEAWEASKALFQCQILLISSAKKRQRPAASGRLVRCERAVCHHLLSTGADLPRMATTRVSGTGINASRD